VVGPEDLGYEQGRRVFNAAVDRRPAAIARCRSSDEVAAALAVAAERGLPVAVRGGGTSDEATLDGGIVIDVGPIDAIDVDPAARTARVGGGVLWADLDAATQDHALAVTGARLSGLGVAGVTLGGGSGWLERALGPTSASLIRAEVVLADGSVIAASEEADPELLWAMRGRGIGLGVVTELELELSPVGPKLLAGLLTYERRRASEVARAYRDFAAEAAPAVGGGLLLSAGGGGGCTIVFSFLGEVEDGERAIAPLLELGPFMNAVRPNEYRALQAMSDARLPYGMRVHRRTAPLRELSDDGIEAVIEAADRPAASLSHVLIRPLGGAVAGKDGAAWAHECIALWPPLPSLDAGNIGWVDGVVAALEPFAVASDRSETRERLQRVKERLDPGGIFRLAGLG
jgi:FAD/FMN-containing dehydrogenase